LAQTDIKASPIDEGVIGGLNRKLGTVARKCGTALGNGGADGIGPARPKEKATRQRREQATDQCCDPDEPTIGAET
jgi:hypothetical protein